MISGSELRNAFNRIMRTLYTIKDSSGSGVSGRSGYARIKSSSYIDTYIQICYDLLDKYDKIDSLNESKVISFIDDFMNYTIHFLGNPIEETTRVKSKKIIKEYLNEIKNNYEEKIVIEKVEKYIKEIENYEVKNIFESHTTKKYDENSKGVKFDKGFKTKENYYEEPKKSKAPNKIYEILEHLQYCINKFSISNTAQNFILEDFNKLFTKSETLEGKSSIKSFIKSYITLSKSVLNYVNISDFQSVKSYLKHTAKEIEKELLNKRPSLELNLIAKVENIQPSETQNVKEEPMKHKEHHNKETSKTKNNNSSLKENVIIKFLTNKKIIFGIILMVLLCFIYINSNIFMPNSPIENNITITNISENINDEILDKPIQPVIEEYMLSSLEQQVIDLINEKRIRYGKTELNINIDLSEIARDYLEIDISSDSETAKNEIGDLSVRKEKSNTNVDIIESQYTYDITDSDVANVIVGRIVNSNLYNEKYNNIGIAIIEEENTYNILIDLY